MAAPLAYLSFEAIAGGWQAEVYLSADHPAFVGHFPSQAIFPGVSQIELVLQLVERGLQRPLTIAAVQRAKFLAILGPDQLLRIEASLHDGTQVRWQIQDAGKIYSTGLLSIEDKKVLE